jgi:hypothetical protein
LHELVKDNRSSRERWDNISRRSSRGSLRKAVGIFTSGVVGRLRGYERVLVLLSLVFKKAAAYGSWLPNRERHQVQQYMRRVIRRRVARAIINLAQSVTV